MNDGAVTALIQQLAAVSQSESSEVWVSELREATVDSGTSLITSAEEQEAVPNPFTQRQAADLSEDLSSRTRDGSPSVLDLYLRAATDDLRQARVEARARANRAFLGMLAIGILGGLLIVAGFVIGAVGASTAGIASGVGGLVATLASGVFGKLYSTESKNLQELISDLRRFESVRLGLLVAAELSDPKQRDRAIEGITMRLSEWNNGKS